MPGIDVTVLGDLNIDIILRVNREIIEDSSTLASDTTIMPGGVGANITSNLVHMGLKTRILGAVGRDVFGDYIIGELTRRRINVDYVQRRTEDSTGLMVVLVKNEGRKTIIGSRGANAYFSLDTNSITMLSKETRHVHVSGYAALNNDKGRTLIGLLKTARENNKTTSIDLEGIAQYAPWFLEEIKGLVDYVFLNRVEAESLCSTREAVECSQHVLKKIDARILFLKIGEEGSIVIIRGTDGSIKSSRVEPCRIREPIDCTGAGDAFNAAVIAALLEGETILNAAKRGNKAGAEACKRIGGFV